MGVGLPTSLNWENFTTVIVQGKLAISFFNSVLYAGSSTVIGTIVAAFAAFVLSRRRTRMNRFLYFFLIMGIALPINFFTLTTMMQMTHLINTRHGMIILYSAMNIPFAVFLIYGFIETIPRELDEAAIIDGARAVPALLPDHPAAAQAGSGDHRHPQFSRRVERVPVSRCTT